MQTRETSEKNEGDRIPSEKKGAKPLSRDECLLMISETIKKLHTRVNSVRFKEQSADGAKLAHVRALVAILTVYSGLLKDSDLLQLEERITKLEEEADRE